MANGRPPGETPDRSPQRRRGRSANEEGLAALEREMRGGAGGGAVANESGLAALGQRVDAANTKGGSSGLRRSGQPRWSVGKKVVVALVSVVVLLVAMVGGGYAYLWYRYNQLNKVHINAEVAAQNGAPFTVLVIGSDTRAGESAQGVKAFGSSSVVTGQRSDVVQLWRVTPSTKQIQIVSIPRDTVVTMLPPDNEQYGTYNRINSSYNIGPNQLVKTITANLGIPINHVVTVDFSGFQNAVNALGGIYMDFPYPAKDAYSGLNITTPGCQLLNGAQALAVARARHYEYYANGYWQYDGTSDFGRIQRQDAFIKAMMSAAKSKVDPLTVNAFIGSVHEGITIDDGFGFNELIGLALAYHSYDPASLGGMTLPTVPSNGFGSLGDVLTVEQPQAQQMLVNVFGSSLVAPTNPPPDASGVPNPPPPVTPTTAAPPASSASKSGAGSAARLRCGGRSWVLGGLREARILRGQAPGSQRPPSSRGPQPQPAPPARTSRPPPRRGLGPARSSSRWRT
jgi:LCP family protein required for cell wall assembly